MKKKSFLDGVAIGILVGFLLSTFSMWMISEIRPIVATSLSDHAAHLVTLVAAAIALYGVSRQIQSNLEIANQQRQSRLDAARSTLPIVLSNIVFLCENRIESLGRGDLGDKSEGWKISDFEIETIKECIENANSNEQRSLQEILRIYQVLVARWRDQTVVNLWEAPEIDEKSYDILSMWNQFGSMTNWAALRAVCESLFDYSRGKDFYFDKDRTVNSTIRFLDGIGTATLRSGTGLLLKNQPNYFRFLERLNASRKIEFLDTDW